MAKFFFTADDYGIDIDRDCGIILALIFRTIDKVGIITTNDNSQKRIKILKTISKKFNKNIKLGIHINLPDKKLITTDLINICRNYSKNQNSKILYWQNALNKTLNLKEIEKEIRAQIDRFINLTKSKPYYIDGHNHCQIANIEVYKIFLKLSKEYGIKKIRFPQEKLDYFKISSVLEHYNINDIYHKIKFCEYLEKKDSYIKNKRYLNELCLNMKKNPLCDILLYDICCYRIIKSNLEINSDKFLGTTYGHIRKYSYLKKIFKNLKRHDFDFEIMVHIGFFFPIKHFTKFSNFDRVQEFINLLIFKIYYILIKN